MDSEQLLEVEVGRAQPATIGLSPGEPVGPLSIGRMGGWRVAANGVAAEHGWIYFDGQTLYLQSTDPQTPMSVDGQPVPTTWTAIHAPCAITFGAARIALMAAAEEIERTADKFPAPTTQGVAPAPSPPARPFAPGAFSHRAPDADQTRMGPMDVAAARARASSLSTSRSREAEVSSPFPFQSHPPRAEEPPRAEDPPERAPVSAGGGGAAHAAPHAAPPAAAPPAPLGDMTTRVQDAPRTGLLAQWHAASLPQKATVFLLPLALTSVYVIFSDGQQAPDPSQGEEAPSASASSAPAASAPAASATASSATASSATAAPSPKPPSSMIAAAPEESAPPPSPPPATPGTIEAAPEAPTPTTPAPAPAIVARPGVGQRTLERRAADSVAAGDWEGAALLYEQLAKEHPSRPAFAEAARILRARAK